MLNGKISRSYNSKNNYKTANNDKKISEDNNLQSKLQIIELNNTCNK